MAVIEAPVSAEDRAEARTRTHRVPTLVAAFLALLMLAGHRARCAGRRQVVDPQADRVIAAVSHHLGARYVWGSTGPNGFDCSGLVYRAFREAHLAQAHRWLQHRPRLLLQLPAARARPAGSMAGQATSWSTTDGGHVGIYLGRGKVISALLSGVKVHRSRASTSGSRPSSTSA